MARVSYGFDAPGIMRGLIAVGLLTITASILLLSNFGNTAIKVIAYVLLTIGIIALALGISMFIYGILGKYRVRDLMLSKIDWRGDETVLDIGTGQGLLMIGAAKRLTSGTSIGIDIWSSKDLTNNTRERALENARLEGVSARVVLVDADAQSLDFPDHSFDVILSQFCLHNIEEKSGQEKACFEIARVLKPGGVALIGDYIPTTAYASYFAKAGLRIISSRQYIATALGLTWIVHVVKDR